MKQQTEPPSNMSSVEIGFDPNQIKNVPFEKYEKDFTLFVNDRPYKMSRIVADLLSPKIRRLHFIDNTITEYYISTSTFNEEIEKGKENKKETESKKLDTSTKKEEQNFMKEIIETIEKGNLLRIEKGKDQEQEQRNHQMSENESENTKLQINIGKRSFVCEIMKELGKEEYFRFFPEFSTKITKDNVIGRIKAKIQFEMSNEENEHENKNEKENDCTDRMNNILKKQIMREEIEFISKHFYKMIKEGSKSRENMKKLEAEIIEMIIENENLRLENEESLLKLINELYEEDQKYSILYEYVEFSNILEANTKAESNNNDSNSNINSNDINDENQSNYNNKDKTNEEMCKFIKIFDINDLSTRIWNQIFGKFIIMNQTSNNFSDYSTNNKNEEKGEKNAKSENNKRYKRYLHKQKYNIIEIEGSKETNELNGIMRYLTNETKGNIHDNETINITSNSIINNNNNNYHPKYLVDFDELKYYHSNNEANTYLCFDFKDKQIEISKYQIKSYAGGVNYYYLKSWKLEISNDGNKWEEIDRRSNCGTLNGSRNIGTFEIEKERQFGRFVRLTQTGKNWRNADYVVLYNIEFYGRIKEMKK